MDWIERLSGFAPDNGDGSFEFLIMFAVAAVLVGAILLWRVPGAYAALQRLFSRFGQRSRTDRLG